MIIGLMMNIYLGLICFHAFVLKRCFGVLDILRKLGFIFDILTVLIEFEEA